MTPRKCLEASFRVIHGNFYGPFKMLSLLGLFQIQISNEFFLSLQITFFLNSLIHLLSINLSMLWYFLVSLFAFFCSLSVCTSASFLIPSSWRRLGFIREILKVGSSTDKVLHLFRSLLYFSLCNTLCIWGPSIKYSLELRGIKAKDLCLNCKLWANPRNVYYCKKVTIRGAFCGFHYQFFSILGPI